MVSFTIFFLLSVPSENLTEQQHSQQQHTKKCVRLFIVCEWCWCDFMFSIVDYTLSLRKTRCMRIRFLCGVKWRRKFIIIMTIIIIVINTSCAMYDADANEDSKNGECAFSIQSPRKQRYIHSKPTPKSHHTISRYIYRYATIAINGRRPNKTNKVIELQPFCSFSNDWND